MTLSVRRSTDGLAHQSDDRANLVGEARELADPDLLARGSR